MLVSNVIDVQLTFLVYRLAFESHKRWTSALKRRLEVPEPPVKDGPNGEYEEDGEDQRVLSNRPLADVQSWQEEVVENTTRSLVDASTQTKDAKPSSIGPPPRREGCNMLHVRLSLHLMHNHSPLTDAAT